MYAYQPSYNGRRRGYSVQLHLSVWWHTKRKTAWATETKLCTRILYSSRSSWGRKVNTNINDKLAINGWMPLNLYVCISALVLMWIVATLQPGTGYPRTGLDLEANSRTNLHGLGGLDKEAWPWPWPRTSCPQTH